MISRKIKWISSANPSHNSFLETLNTRLSNFYAENPYYYGNIDFTSNNWKDIQQVGYSEIVDFCKQSRSVFEFGCGSANLLHHYPELSGKYSGCDFSDTLMKKNSEKYPDAIFRKIEIINLLPFSDISFDLVFSVFVLEHCTNPLKLLAECNRILKPGGTLIILCPEYMESGRIPSQRAGFSAGTSSSKLKRGKFLDALVTLYDNRIKIPAHCKELKQLIKKSPQFFINTEPVVFDDPFIPDVDAVYVTCKDEIISFLGSKGFEEIPNDINCVKYEKEQRLILLKMRKNKN